jgi:hypothetical protein
LGFWRKIRCVQTIRNHETRVTLYLNVNRYDVFKPYTIMRHERLSTSMYTDTMCSNHTHSCDTSDSRPRCIQIRCVQTIHSHATRATLDLDLYRKDVFKSYTIMRHERLSTSMYIDTMCSNHAHSCHTSDSRPRCIQIRCVQTMHNHATRATLDLDLYRHDVFKSYTLMRHVYTDTMRANHTQSCDASDPDLDLYIYTMCLNHTSIYRDTMCSNHTHSCDTSDFRPRCI